MSDAVPLKQTQTDERREKYFSFQIKGWTNFDPMDKTLTKIAAGIEQGGGFLTRMEVLRVETDLACISDEEARECFANILAAQRLVRNVHGLPKKLIEDLRSALKAEGEVVPPRPIVLVESSAMNHGPRAKPWP